MRRRRLLAATAGALAVAGCAGRAAPNDDEPDDSDPDGDAFDEVGCVSFAETDRTNCYRRDGRDPDAYVVPSTATFEDHEADGEVQTMQFTLHVEGDRAFQLDTDAWAIFEHGDADGWTRVASDGTGQGDPGELAPGETLTWSLATETHPSPNDDVWRITAALDSGLTHAFRVVGGFVDGPRVEAVAVFDYVRSTP